MRLQVVLRYLGLILLLDAAFLFLSFLVALLYYDSSSIPLLFSSFIAFLLGIFPLIFVPKTIQVNNHEGIMIVVFGWVLTCLLGSLPYVLWGSPFTLTNAWFESVSGFTTTGASIITNIEALPKGLLFWRSATHFIGGIGIIMFVLAFLPMISNNKLIIFNSEMSAVAKSNFQNSVKEALRILVLVYLGLTLLETVMLWVCGMSFYDALLHAFGTIATGGFSTKNESIASFHSLSIEVVIMVFMIFSGIHFGLLYGTLLGKKPNIFKSEIVRYYVLSMFIGIAVISIVNHGKEYPDWGSSIRYASFQVLSLGTTTGFATTDTGHWMPFTKLILIFFSIQCAGAGSTSGGIKVDRILIFFKSIIKQIKLLQHPKAVVKIQINKVILMEDVAQSAVLFIVLYLTIIFFSTLFITAFGTDILTAFSGTVAAIGNVGPGFGQVSSMANYGGLPSAVKWILSADMLLGRIEVYGFLSLFMIKSWR
ncbi:MAG: TrkH family potassium uptake protein [Chlorobi bacterium]|nr:TrkH family potassium uptake protein [Chlorobiota bacterium]